ncbi:D-tyrosyl-tRNA(Tyr) deacylase [bacterium (candidate division B38) B3_B38]|nr:MAG: D-tyrosyl-tRNA(Tyr) deacylase [bacterium (candidate division B38) B3_B38]
MKVLIQKVSRAEVRVANRVVGSIGEGVLLFVGVEKGDTDKDVSFLTEKISHLRIFPDAEGKMNLSLLDVGGEILVVSQFTLAGDVQKGRRPSFDKAAPPETAERYYEEFVNQLKKTRLKVATGEFQAMMSVELVNEGPVTFMVESKVR